MKKPLYKLFRFVCIYFELLYISAEIRLTSKRNQYKLFRIQARMNRIDREMDSWEK